jgi:hypothetical protein
VLLEVRAYDAALGAQLDRVHARLERLDARVATVDGGLPTPARAALSAARLQPAVAARTPSLTLTDFSMDVLDKIVASLDPDDELAASLACRKLRDAIRPPALPSAQQPRRPLKTRLRSLLGSLGKLQWGVTSLDAPLNAALFTRVAGLGDLRMLSWLRARGCGPAARGRQTSHGNRLDRANRQLVAVISRCCSGRAPMAARGTRTRAHLELVVATWLCCSGRVPSAALVTGPRAHSVRLIMVDSRNADSYVFLFQGGWWCRAYKTVRRPAPIGPNRARGRIYAEQGLNQRRKKKTSYPLSGSSNKSEVEH